MTHQVPVGYSLRPLIVLSIIISFFSLSCKKDCEKEEEVKNTLIINFNEATISALLVDSAEVIFTREGSSTPYFQRLFWEKGALSTSIESLGKGKWSAHMIIYGRSGTDNTGRLYETIGTIIRSGGDASVYFNAPNGSIADSWKPRVVLTDIARTVKAIIALDNTDPFFQIVVKDSKWDIFEVERLASNRNNIGNELIASYTWRCNQSCYTNDRNIIDKISFVPFTQTVSSKTWNNGEINVTIKDTETTVQHELFYIYNK